MEGHPDSHAAPGAAAGQGDLLDLAAAFRAALAAPDVRRARSLVADAAAAGAAVGVLYVDVVRPALAELQQADRNVRARLAAGIGEAILADLVGALPVAESCGAGRAAVLSCRDSGIEAVDGSVALDFLETDGWTVDRLQTGTSLPDVAEVAAKGIELVVAVTAGPEDALALARVCTDLCRLPDPPVIVLCDFSGRSRHRAATAALGADAMASDPEELVRCAAKHLPGSGHRRWGVRISRLTDTLVLAPTGRLDATSVGRLADVAMSRAARLTRLVIDLRDLAEIPSAGLIALVAWPALPALSALEVVVVGDAATRLSLGRHAAPRTLRTEATVEDAVA